MGCFIRPPAAQILAPAKTVIENTRGTVDAKERESHLRAWGVKKVRWVGRVGRLDGVQVNTLLLCSLKSALAAQVHEPPCAPAHRPCLYPQTPPPFLPRSGWALA